MTEPINDQFERGEAIPGASPPNGDPVVPEKATDRFGKPKGKGFLYATIPVVVFVTANALLPLTATIVISVVVGLGLVAFRLLKGERPLTALGSLVGIAFAAALVAVTGSAKNYFVVGIWAYFVGFLIAALSLLIRRPVTGVIWNFTHGRNNPWREDRGVLRAHFFATLAAAVVLGARFGVQQWLYLVDSTNGLGFARIAMGTPMSLAVAVVVVWAFRRSSKLLIGKPGQGTTSPDERAP
ncbi:DUF3159 domain-containing protein [Umezawaea sp.]|uniref:DUF3159 domain-containing protein n=1 Tax=Umezawaea sp. TaxID=1955258 RepID=UPI002ED10865